MASWWDSVSNSLTRNAVPAARASAATPPPSRVAALLAARRKMIDRVLPEKPGDGTGETIARNPGAAELLAVAGQPGAGSDWGWAPSERVNHRINEADGLYSNRQALGVFGDIASGIPESYNNPSVIGVVAYPRGDWKTRKHEVMHGINAAARLGERNMPYWSRVVAANPLGMRRFLDEFAATAAEGPKAVALKTLAWPAYALRYAADGDIPSALAATGAFVAPTVGIGLGLGGAVGGAHVAAHSYGRGGGESRPYAPRSVTALPPASVGQVSLLKDLTR